MCAAYVACHSKAVVHLARFQETIVHSYGENAHIYSICTVYSNGSERLRRNNNVQWIEDHGLRPKDAYEGYSYPNASSDNIPF